MTQETHEYGHPFNYESKPVARYVDIFAELAGALPRGLSVTELFGGVGRLAAALRPVLEPTDWVATELDWECVMEFRKNAPWAVCLWGDAFSVEHFNDLVLIDPHKGTLNAIAKESTWVHLFDSIATSEAKYILMQEYGAYWCHLPNHKKLYMDLFGVLVDKYNYRDHFTQYMESNYGFKVLSHRIGLGSCYYLMEVR